MSQIYSSLDLPDGSRSLMPTSIPKDITDIIDLILDGGPHVRNLRAQTLNINYYALPTFMGIRNIQNINKMFTEKIIENIISICSYDPEYYMRNTFWVDLYRIYIAGAGESILFDSSTFGREFISQHFTIFLKFYVIYLTGYDYLGKISHGKYRFMEAIAVFYSEKNPWIFEIFPSRDQFKGGFNYDFCYPWVKNYITEDHDWYTALKKQHFEYVIPKLMS